jgi:putative membrane protein
MTVDSRTLQANERTLLAWLRTGVSLITFGFAIAQAGEWLRETGRIKVTGRAELVGGVFVLVGALMEVLGLGRYARIRRALLLNREVPTDAKPLIAIVLLVAAIGLVIGGQILLR